MSKQQFKMTDFFGFQFKLFCFERKKKCLMQKESKNDHCFSTGQPKAKILLAANETDWRNCNEKFSFKISLGILSFLEWQRAHTAPFSSQLCLASVGASHRELHMRTHEHSVFVLSLCVQAPTTRWQAAGTHMWSTLRNPRNKANFRSSELWSPGLASTTGDTINKVLCQCERTNTL